MASYIKIYSPTYKESMGIIHVNEAHLEKEQIGVLNPYLIEDQNKQWGLNEIISGNFSNSMGQISYYIVFTISLETHK